MRRALALLALLASAGCHSGTRADPNVIIAAMTNGAVVLDPRVGADEASQKAHQLLFNTLVRIDDDLGVVPELADLERPDPATYVARLRRGVLFHNQRELTADDVVYTFRSLIDPNFRGRTGAYRILAAVNALDRYTVEFKLKEPFGSFPINLVMGIVQAGSGAANERTPIGTGPYKLAEFIPDDRLTLAPFDQYFGGRPKNNGVVLKVVPDDTMRGLELRKGSVDIVVNDVAPDIFWGLREEGRLRWATSPGTDFAYLGQNLKHPILSKLDVRRAIASAIDRDAIVKHLRRGLAVASGGIIPPMSWAAARDLTGPAYDPAGSRRLLDGAGHPDPDGNGPLPRFTLTLRTSTSEVYRVQAAAIQHDLAQVGIAVDVRTTEFQTLLGDVVRGNFELYTLQFVGATDPDILRRVFHSSQQPPAGLNRVYYSNPEVDRMIDAASVEPDETARRELYVQAQRIIAADVPYVPLWTKTNVAVFQPDIDGVRLSPIADFTFMKDLRRVTAPVP
jgi:peptide/nickel transport system substrate-binding protein